MASIIEDPPVEQLCLLSSEYGEEKLEESIWTCTLEMAQRSCNVFELSQGSSEWLSLKKKNSVPSLRDKRMGLAKFSIQNDFRTKPGNSVMCLVWDPQEYEPQQFKQRHGIECEQFYVPVHDFLTIRLHLYDTGAANITIHVRGGKLLGTFSFQDALVTANEFLTKMREYVDTTTLKDEFKSGELFTIDRKPLTIQHHSSSVSEFLPSEDVEDSANLLKSQGCRKPCTNIDRILKRIVRRQSRLLPLSWQRYIGRTMNSEKRRCLAEDKGDVHSCDNTCLRHFNQVPNNWRGIPVQLHVWKEAFSCAGRLNDPMVLKYSIFMGGVGVNTRSLVWPFLLGFYSWDSSNEERRKLKAGKKIEYEHLKKNWNLLYAVAEKKDTMCLKEIPGAARFRIRKRVDREYADCLEAAIGIKKDVVRSDGIRRVVGRKKMLTARSMETILNVYAMHNRSLSYCQGMCDFLSPLIDVLECEVENEALIFWCFVGLMHRVESNFRVDEAGIRWQLSKLKKILCYADRELSLLFEECDPDLCSCYRWIILQFKREFQCSAALRLWEVLWTQPIGDDLHIFIAAAILLDHKEDLILLREHGFDEMLRYINDLSMRINVDCAIHKGYVLCRMFGFLLSGRGSV